MLDIALWWIWRWCNELVFNDGSHLIKYKVAWIKSQSSEIVNTFASHLNVGVRNLMYAIIFFGWLPLEKGWFKINTNG